MTTVNTKLFSILNRLNLHRKSVFSHYRHSSNYSSPFVVDIGDVNVKYEVSKDPEEWKYVERALPALLVPTPTPKPKYNSEWRPQAENVADLPFYVARNKNHMMPVYLNVSGFGMNKTTILKRIQGDIWLLERQLREFLQSQQLKPLRMQVNEFSGMIRISGDHVNAIKYWLMQRNL